MRLKRFILLLVFSLVCVMSSSAQGIAINPQTGNLNVLDAGTCAVSSGSSASSFVVQQLPQNAGTSTVTLAGTFSVIVTVRLSANGGTTWVTQSTQTSVGTASYAVAGFNYICVDVTTYTSGTVNVTINSSLASSGGITSVASANSGLAGPGAIYPNAPPYNISFDGKQCFGTHVSWTTANPSVITLDGTTCSFSASEIGTSIKKAFGTNGCCGNASALAASAVLPIGTITITSATSATVASAGTACNTVVCEFHWFTDDRAKWCCGAGTVDNAWNTSAYCPTVVLPAGWSPIPFLLFNSPGQATCASGNFGTVSHIQGQTDGGPTVIGQGISNSVLLIPPDNLLSSCNGGGGSVCLFFGVTNMEYFSVTGGGNGLTGQNGNVNNKILVGPSGIASFNESVSLTAYGSGDTGTLIGFQIPFSNKNNAIYVDQFGSNPCNANATKVILTNSFCGDSKGADLLTAGTTILATQNLYFGISSTSCVTISAGTTWYSLQDSNYNSCGAGANPAIVVNGVAHIEQHTQTGTGFFDGIQLAAGGIAHIRNSVFAGATQCIHNNAVTLTTGALFNEGGNTCLSHNISTAIIPTWTSTGTGTTPCVPTTDTAALAITGNESGTFTCTAAVGAAATGTFNMTFAGTFSLSGKVPACNLTLKDGTGAWTLPTAVKELSSSTTTYVWSWFNTGALTSTLTYKGAWNCTAQ